MIPVLPAPALAVLRYFVSWLCVWLVNHGWSMFALNDDATEGVAEMIGGGLVALWMMGIGAWRSTVPALLARLKEHHKPALLAAAGDVSLTKATEILTAASAVAGVQKIVAEPSLAAATPSDKVVAA